MLKQKISALIPIRKGSLRVENKNIRPFAGSTLLELKIRKLRSSALIDEIVVNTNDPDAMRLARYLDVTVVERDNYHASNEVSMNEVYLNMALNMKCDIVVHTPCTSPLVTPQTVDAAIRIYLEQSGEFDSLNSVSEVKEFLIGSNGPVNFNLDRIPRSQDLPDIYKFNWGVSVVSRQTMIERKSVVGHKPHLFPIDELEAFDVDTMTQFQVAEMLYTQIQMKS